MITMIHTAFALPFLNHFADLSRITSTALIAAIWQGTLLALIAALALRLFPRIPAAARFAIWFAVFTLIAALPFAAFAPNHVATIAVSTSSHAWLNLDSRWTLAIAAIWVAASLLRAATFIAAALRVRTLSRNATPIHLAAPQAPAISRRPQLCVSSDIDRPTVIGFLSPKILIPAWLLEKLTPAELDHIVLHESGHLNRADDWLNLLQKLALVLFPLNPALAWVERRLCFERELACDERVLAALASREQSATGYASSLTTIAEYRLQHRGAVRAAARHLALALGALGTSARQSELGRRVARILRPAARMKPLHVRLATGAAIAALLFTTTGLEHTPQLISFASPEPPAQLASAAPELLRGYHTVVARITVPAPVQVKPIADASTRFSSVHSRNANPSFSGSAGPRAITVSATTHADRVRQTNTAHLIAARQPEPRQGGLVITRWAVFESGDGYRVVRTSAVFSETPPPQNRILRDADSTPDTEAPQTAHPLRAQRISQPVSPYAAVPVPGGWLVFQL